MSSSNPSDPRLLLPDWLRDGDTPLPVPTQPQPTEPVVVSVEEAEVVVAASVPTAAEPLVPFSERLSLDTRLDPQLLVSPEDLPDWLGGLDRLSIATDKIAPIQRESIAPAALVASSPAPVAPLAEPEPYDGVDAPEPGVIEVEVNGWYVVAGALGLIILLAAALRLYLS
jgi:hypothetical protein